MYNTAMPFDIRALIVASIFVMMVLSLLDVVIWRTRASYPGLGRWTLGHALVGPTLILFAFRTVLPDFLSVFVANAVSIYTAILIQEAAREFRGLRPRIWQPYAGGACAVATLAYFRYVDNNLNARAFVQAICVGTISLMAAKTLLTDVPEDRSIGLKYTGWLVVACATLQIGRGVYYCTQPVVTDIFLWSIPNLIAFVGLSLGLTGISFGVLVMSGERMMADLKESERSTARANLELNRLRRGLETAVIERTAELRETQSALLQSQKLEGIGRLAGGIAHDFNNFLTIIEGHSKLLLQELDPSSPIREGIAQMKAAGEQAILLTQQLLAVGRRQSLELKVVDLNDVARGMAKMLAHLLGENIEVVIIAGSSTARVRADSGQMHQVILNLFLNARDAMPNGGKVEIETCDATVTEADAWRLPGASPGPYVELVIRDTGTGMDQHARDHLFEPFFTTKPIGHGTGLGLATVYGIVRQSGGYIHVETAPGKGTSFAIFFPLVDEDIAPVEEPLDHRAANPSLILLVDDAMPIRNVLRRVLERGGYQVMEAEDAESALELLRAHSFDVLLTDLQMPGRSGIELAQVAARDYPRIKVIAMSGLEASQLSHLPRELGIEAALAKPMPPHALLAAVRAALNKKTMTA